MEMCQTSSKFWGNNFTAVEKGLCAEIGWGCFGLFGFFCIAVVLSDAFFTALYATAPCYAMLCCAALYNVMEQAGHIVTYTCSIA